MAGLTKISDLEDRVNRLGASQASTLSTEETNTVRMFWIHLHWTPDEAKEYYDAEKRQEEISAAGSVYLNAEQNREYMDLAKRQVELVHDVAMHRTIADDALRDRVWPEFVPRVLRFLKLTEKPSNELSSSEAKELETIQRYFSELQRRALGETSKQ